MKIIHFSELKQLFQSNLLHMLSEDFFLALNCTKIVLPKFS